MTKWVRARARWFCGVVAVVALIVVGVLFWLVPTVVPPVQALLTPVIAAITVYIAWQQWQTNTRKLVLDLYARRLPIYQRVVEFLGFVLRDYKVEVADVIKFRFDTAEADFLFGPEIRAYFDEIVDQALALHVASLEYRDYTQVPPAGYDHGRVVAEMHEREAWFRQQHAIALQKFTKYLHVGHV